jgi:hypothetical protein
MKHIESIQPEYAADDMTALLLSDATASAALTALLHSVTGCAIPPLATIPESEVEELVHLCLSILRRHWTTPLTALGDGTTPMSLADLMRRLILGRVDGNESLGIPPANANIPTAVSALTKRHIDDGLTLTLTDGGADGSTPTTTSLPDGLSLAQLLCSGLADNITELQDSNKGWTANGSSIQSLISRFSALKRLEINCKEIIGTMNQAQVKGEVYAPELITLNLTNGYGGAGYMAKQMIMPKCREIYGHNRFWQTTENNIIVEKMVLGSLSNFGIGTWSWNTGSQFGTAPNLLHMEYGADGLGGLQVSQNLSWWTATNVLSERLPEFLSNFKTYIAQRLTDKGSGLTLTLSQAVRDAIQTDPEIVSIITSKGWTISPAPSV